MLFEKTITLKDGQNFKKKDIKNFELILKIELKDKQIFNISSDHNIANYKCLKKHF